MSRTELKNHSGSSCKHFKNWDDTSVCRKSPIFNKRGYFYFVNKLLKIPVIIFFYWSDEIILMVGLQFECLMVFVSFLRLKT